MAHAQDVAATGVVVGMKELTGEVRSRVDIDVLLVSHPDTFNLFMQALATLQQNPKLLGIHGLPSNTWDEVRKKFKDTFGGYCAHGVLVFPTWHRPYLSLVEQTIYLTMVEIAGKYDPPYRQKYLAAAKEFRLPYLDYFRPRDGPVKFPGVLSRSGTETSFPYNFRLPDILNENKVALRLPPNDTLKYDIDNPLYSYKFTKEHGQLPAVDQDQIKQWYSTSQTVRYPDNLASTTHNLQQLSNALNSGREGRNTLALALIHSQPYEKFSTVASDKLEKGDITLFTQDGGASGSLEGSIHGNYHNIIGGTGHMSTPSLAAFDPVFWFHHCQVDRLWAFWQAFHPNAWFPKPKVGELAENQKDLLPFYKSRTGPGKGTFYSSDDAKTTQLFGYVYDDFVGIKDGDVQALRKHIDDKYIWASRTPTHPTITDCPIDMKPLNVQSTHFFSKAPKVPTPSSATVSIPIITRTNGSTLPANTGKASVAGVANTATSSLKAAVESAPTHMHTATNSGQDTTVTSLAPTKINSKFDREWYVDSVVNRAAANGPFTIYFFLALSGEVTMNPAQFSQSPHLAGLNHIFAAPREICDNCGDQEAAGQLASDTTPITPLLLDYLDLPDNGLESLQPEHVKPFLVKYLRWRVVYNGNDKQDPREVPGLRISVSAKVYHDDGTKTYEVYPDIVEDIIRNASASASV